MAHSVGKRCHGSARKENEIHKKVQQGRKPQIRSGWGERDNNETWSG